MAAQAIQIDISAISGFLLKHEMVVYLVVCDKKAYLLGKKVFSKIERYIDDTYVEEYLLSEGQSKKRQDIAPSKWISVVIHLLGGASGAVNIQVN